MHAERFDFVCLGAGVVAGYWAEELAALIKAGSTTGEAGSRPRICIISAYPDGLAPYERSELSKECLRPGATHSRDWQAWGNKVFPYTSSGNNREARSARWYRDSGITILAWCECYEVDASTGTLKLLQYSERVRTKAKAKTMEIMYGSLLVATGSSPRRLDGDTGGSPCFCVKHPDLHGARLDKQDAYGLGSAHYLRDLGDCIKLVKALGSLPVGGSSTVGVGMARGGDANTVALVGGGLLCMEVAAAIVTHYPSIRPIMLIAGQRLLPDLFNQELSDFYEAKLSEAGVVVVRDVRAERLWGLEEQGEFETLGGQKVHFGPAPRGYTECRGVVLRGKGDITIHVPARVVFIGIGSVPNSELFRGQLELSSDGGVNVDSMCRAMLCAEASGKEAIGPPVYAAGDVASYLLPLEAFKRVRFEHVQNARDMAIIAARNMVASMGASEAAGAAGGKFSNGGGIVREGSMNDARLHEPIPGFSSKFLGLSWRFYGIPEGDVVVLGAGQFRTTRTFGAFWVRGERVVGAFLEGGTLEQQIAVAQVSRLRPKVFSAKILKESQLGDFLEDPGSIEASDDSDFAQLLMCCRCV